jgi:phage gpG-like protein
VAPVGILMWTHRLQRSFAGGGPEHVRLVTPTELRWGSRVPYAAHHQYGTRRVPARPIVAFRSPAERENVLVLPIKLHVMAALEPGLIRAVVEPRVFRPPRV